MNLLPLPKLTEKLSVGKVSIYRYIAEHGFPKPVKLGGRAVWIEAEVDEWVMARAAEREVKLVDGHVTPT